jgi:hypothetical protein
VNFSTRGPNTLDFVLTKLKDIYEDPIKRPPFGLSDYFSVQLHPKAKLIRAPPSTSKVKLREMRPSRRVALRSYLELVNVSTILNSAILCVEKVSLLGKIIQNVLDSIIPLRIKAVYLNEPPWTSLTLKNLMEGHDLARACGIL